MIRHLFARCTVGLKCALFDEFKFVIAEVHIHEPPGRPVEQTRHRVEEGLGVKLDEVFQRFRPRHEVNDVEDVSLVLLSRQNTVGDFLTLDEVTNHPDQPVAGIVVRLLDFKLELLLRVPEHLKVMPGDIASSSVHLLLCFALVFVRLCQPVEDEVKDDFAARISIF